MLEMSGTETKSEDREYMILKIEVKCKEIKVKIVWLCFEKGPEGFSVDFDAGIVKPGGTISSFLSFLPVFDQIKTFLLHIYVCRGLHNQTCFVKS